MSQSRYNATMPLATRMRPRCLDQYIGQQHLLAEGKPLSQVIKQGKPHSMILWGPPGTGKTTLAELIGDSCQTRVASLSAVLSGVKDIRQVVAEAKQVQQLSGQATILFVDEVHRFNKAQQDAFLPHVEQGDIILIGATTENPSFHLNNALLSRVRVYVLTPLSQQDLLQVLQQALLDKQNGLGERKLQLSENVRQSIVQFADGDARQCLNCLELLADFAKRDNDAEIIDEALLGEVLRHGMRRFDNQGEDFYDQMSALHKSLRGSDPNAALYWLARMLDGGGDPEYIARRLVRMASEDIGNADPRALQLALDAWQSFERLGSPEGELALAQAVVYLACAPKSNAVYQAFNAAMKDVKQYGSLPVPLHIRNAPTKLMRQLDYGKGYRYDHDEDQAFAAGQRYFPEAMPQRDYYQPVERGLEIKIKQKLAHLDQLKQQVKA